MLHGLLLFFALYERFFGEFILLRLRSNPFLMRNYGMSNGLDLVGAMDELVEEGKKNGRGF
jgi:hypothetical protein